MVTSRSGHVPVLAALLALLLVALVAPAGAQIVETRQGDANPMVSVFKSTIYGGLAGLVLGGAIELIDEDDDSDALRWGFVSGVFVGFGYGIYHIATRAEPHALLEGGSEGWALALPEPVLAVRREEPWLRDAGGVARGGERSLAVGANLLALRF
jgi:hypothetical protein